MGCRNNYKGHMDNNKVEWKQGREMGRSWVAGRDRGERQKTVLEQQFKKRKKEKISHRLGKIFSNHISIKELVFRI